jgi:glutamine amidotransferase
MVGLVEAVGASHGVPQPMQMTVATTDGRRLWAFRYSTAHRSRSLFYSTDVRTLRETHPDNPDLRLLPDEARAVVSEPVVDLVGAWNEVPESSYGVIQEGADEIHPFRPRRP